MPIKRLTPNRHFHLIERILHHIVRIQLIYPPQYPIDIRLLRFREDQELRPYSPNVSNLRCPAQQKSLEGRYLS